MKLADIHLLIGGEYLNPSNHLSIQGIASWKNANSDDITFVFKNSITNVPTKAGAIVASKPIEHLNVPQIICSNPRLAMTLLLQRWVANKKGALAHTVHQSAIVDPTAILNTPVCLGAHVSIGKHTKIGRNAIIHSNVTIGDYCIIGDNCTIFPNVSLYNHTTLGKACQIHAGCVIGSDGFGYEKNGSAWEKIHHIGGVLVGDNVEIGSNTCIDRGCLDHTAIGNGVKLDNLVHIAHNCFVGDHTAIAAGTLLAGSVSIGMHCMIGGKVAISNNCVIGDHVTIMGNSGVTKSIAKGQVVSGYPAKPHKEALKKDAFFNRFYESRN